MNVQRLESVANHTGSGCAAAAHACQLTCRCAGAGCIACKKHQLILSYVFYIALV